MERNTLTFAKNLQIGDRFYKATDRQKTVLQMIPGETKVTFYTTYDLWCRSDTDHRPKAIKSDTQVIFLRHAIPATAQ